MSVPKRPKVRRPKAWRFPRPLTAELANGVRVLVFHRPGQFVVSAGLALDVSLSSEPAASEGVGELTARTLDQGTARRPGTDFADAVEACGAALEAHVGYDHVAVTLDVPGGRLGTALNLLAQAVTEPQLADIDVERQRTLRLAQLEQQLAGSAERANHALRRAVVDPGCRESRLRSGEPDTLATVSGADVRVFHARHWGPEGTTLVLAGDFDVDAALAVADAELGGWRNSLQREVRAPAPTARAGAAYLIDRPGSVQADIRWGWFTIDRTDPRWADQQIAGNALGGAYLSRLNRVLREEKGFTYGASLVSAPLRTGGITYAQGSFRNEVVGATLELLPTLVDVTATPVTGAEVKRACDYLVGVSPIRYATASGVCDGVLSLLGVGLGPDFVDAQLEAYRLVTPESASRVTAELIRPDAGALVIVGDAGVLAAQVRAAGWDPTVVGPGEWL